MDKENFVPVEEAKELKALGYDEDNFGYYHGGDPLKFTYTEKIRNKKVSARIKTHNKNCGTSYICTAPLWQQAFDWFENKYGLYLNRSVLCTSNEVLDIRYFINSINGNREVKFYLNYDEFNLYKARIICLRELISMVKEKQDDKGEKT